MRAIGLFIPFLLMSASACEPHEPMTVPFRTARVVDDCAPWDGPAVLIHLTDDAADSTMTGPGLRLSIWRSAGSLGSGRIDLAKDASAFLCDAAGACEPATSGWVRFSHVEPGVRLAGRFLATFADSSLQGPFDATWLKRRVMCG